MECRYGKRRGAPTDRGELSHCSAKELMTTHLEEPADLLDLVGSPLGTTKWMKLSQQRVDLFAESSGDHQWIHTDPQRARGPFKGTVAHSGLTLSLTPMFTSEVLEIRELTMAFAYGLGKVNFCAAVPVGSLVRATVSVISARQKSSGVESVFGLSYDIEGSDRPACTAEVSVLYP
jgi:acyl dehydratase